MGLPSGPLSSSASSELERLKADVATYFPVYETRLTPNSVILLVRVDPATLEERFDRLRQELWTRYYIPQIRYEHGEHVLEIARRTVRRSWGLAVNLALLATTVVTTVLAGSFLWLAYTGGSTLTAADFFLGGISFALPLLIILGGHELAHFVVARRHHVEASLPFFIPVPPPFLLFGTFGAFISLREPIPDKKALLDIGASGPLAGFALALPITVYGMFLSAHAPVLSITNCGPSILGVSYGNFLFGPSLVWAALGEFVPIAFVNLSPVALAGWVGILVTAINLLPAGQLDGGHVFRALLGDRARWVSYGAVALLLFLGLFYNGWIIFAVLILLLGLRHPPPLNDLTRLDWKRWAVGGLAVAVLIGGFVVIPITTPSNGFALENTGSGPLASPPPGTGLAWNLTVGVTDQDLIAHAYLLNASVTSVILGSANGTTPPLTGAARDQYLANSTWIVDLPNGNRTTFSAVGNFSLPLPEYATVDAGATGTFAVVYENPQQATVTIEVTVAELCSDDANPPESTGFMIQ